MIGCLCAALNTLQILPDQSKRRLHVPHSPSRCSPSVNMICKIYKFIQRRRRPGLKPEPRRRPRLRSGPHVCFINTSLEPGYDSRAPCTRIPCLSALARNVHDSLGGFDKPFGLAISVGGNFKLQFDV